MALAFDLTMIGDKELLRALGSWDRAVQAKVVRSSLRKQAKRTGGEVARIVERKVKPNTGLFLAAVKALAKKPVALQRSRKRVGLGIILPPRAWLTPPRSRQPHKWYVPGILEYGDKGSPNSRVPRGPLTPRRFYRDAVDNRYARDLMLLAADMRNDLFRTTQRFPKRRL